MKVTIYDANPGPGAKNWWLKLSWLLGCWYQKLIGQVDAYYGATSWDDAIKWLQSHPTPLLSIQYWGHGSPATVWLAERSLDIIKFQALRSSVVTESIVWFRTCSTFQGTKGQHFAERIGDALNCTVAAHTRVVGIFQGGLHTRKPGEKPSWSPDEGEFKDSKLAKVGLKWGNNTVICLATKVPKGW